MCVPQEKIYNDAPNEFGKFLDSGRKTVSLHELGGLANPFVKAGIYQPVPTTSPIRIEDEVCPDLGETFEKQDKPTHASAFMVPGVEVGMPSCPGVVVQIFSTEDERTEELYEIDRAALAEFISRGIGCRICREFQCGWFFGKLRGFDVYFSCSPTPGMYRAITTSDKSILIIGKNTPKLLPDGLEHKVILLSRLLYVQDRRLNFAHEAIEEKIPLPPQREVKKKEKQPDEPKKKQSRPPIQIYIPYYLSMMTEWLDQLRKTDTTGQPNKDWIVDWLYKNGPAFNHKRLSPRTIYRHINTMMSCDPPKKGKLEHRSAQFTAQWNGCVDIHYVKHFSLKDFTGEIIKAFNIAKKLGFDIKLMRGMDAAEYADKVKISTR